MNSKIISHTVMSRGNESFTLIKQLTQFTEPLYVKKFFCIVTSSQAADWID